MGEHMELTIKDWKIPRERQDEIALASHRNAIAARERLAGEIVPVAGVTEDTGPRADTSLEKLAALKPAFAAGGSITAGNASPVSDGASAVSADERGAGARRGPRAARVHRGIEYAAIHPDEGLLMAPAITVPRLLKRAGLKLADIDLLEIHEAFAATGHRERHGVGARLEGRPAHAVDWARVNVNGSSVAIGHPWAATGGRILATLAYEMRRRGARRGLVSICAAGSMAGAIAAHA
jgi:acetyl-CoA acetyltransferase family protein